MIKIITICFCLTTSLSFAQVETNSALYKTIMAKDSQLFAVGFNTCDISQLGNLLSTEFEFFHDKDGSSDKSQFMHNLSNGLCGSPDKYQSRRELIESSTEIFPLYQQGSLYAAIQHGAHRFYATVAGSKEKFASSARFTHVWYLEDNQWKLRTSLSYDHQTDVYATSDSAAFGDDDEIKNWIKSINIPTLALGVIEHGQMQQIRVFGDLEAGRPAPYNTIFNVASLAKPVTAMLTLKLVSAGKWHLDEPYINIGLIQM